MASRSGPVAKTDQRPGPSSGVGSTRSAGVQSHGLVAGEAGPAFLPQNAPPTDRPRVRTLAPVYRSRPPPASSVGECSHGSDTGDILAPHDGVEGKLPPECRRQGRVQVKNLLG